jgi:polysaccharide biosynthesis/export protein
MRNIFYLLAVLMLASACVTNKKVTLLQKDDVTRKDMPRDTVVRTYDLRKHEYRIQPEDIIRISFDNVVDERYDFFSDPNDNRIMGGGQAGAVALTGRVVDTNGNIEFPVVGKIQVAGLTVFEAEERIQTFARQFMDEAVVKVRLVNFRVTVLGEVYRETTVTTFYNRISLPEAIGMAGGMGELADRSKVKIIRQKGDQVEVGYVNLLDEDLIFSPYYYVHQNDIIIVPPLRQRSFRRYFGPNIQIFVSSVTTLLLVINLLNR